MNLPLLLAACLFCLLALLYWELVLVEGAHLGARVVVWLYDLVAPYYERIKQFEIEFEDSALGLPLTIRLIEIESPRVLDVAAGNGRMARTLLRQLAFDGTVVNLDLSRAMLVQGQHECAPWAERVQWICSPVECFPFAAETFDAVICLEALEFFPDAQRALAECARVLRPNGVLLVSNRIGWNARLMFGKTFSSRAFHHLLAQYPLKDILLHAWQVEYDLAWARKANRAQLEL